MLSFYVEKIAGRTMTHKRSDKIKAAKVLKIF